MCVSSQVTTELLNQERRVTVMEKISEDVLSRLRLSSSAMDAYFASSPDVRRFQECATRVDKIEVGRVGWEIRERL